MTKVAAYLSFDGNCAEAFDLYAAVFGGEPGLRMTYGQSPMADELPAGAAGRVMHTSMTIGGVELMGADLHPGRPYQRPQGMNVMVDLDSAERVGAAFARLAEGGQVTMPVTATFWSPAFGMVTDRFGTPWMLAFVSNG